MSHMFHDSFHLAFDCTLISYLLNFCMNFKTVLFKVPHISHFVKQEVYKLQSSTPIHSCLQGSDNYLSSSDLNSIHSCFDVTSKTISLINLSLLLHFLKDCTRLLAHSLMFPKFMTLLLPLLVRLSPSPFLTYASLIWCSDAMSLHPYWPWTP